MLKITKNRLILSSCASTFVVSLNHPSRCEKKSDWPFDDKNIMRVVSGQNPMFLAAVGMRKKNLYVVDVDIYSVGLQLDQKEICSAKEWYKSSRELSLAQNLIKHAHEEKKLTSSPKIMLTLRFVRDVSQQQIMQAFTDAFKSCSQNATDEFLLALRQVTREKGMKFGEELHFTWLNGGGLNVSKHDDIRTISRNNELEMHLLNVYMNPERSVTPDLLSCLEKNIEVIEQLASTIASSTSTGSMA